MTRTPTASPPPAACTVFIESAAFWAPTLPSWAAARAAFRGAGGATAAALARPAPELLVAAERRRAPDTVVLALEVAAQAVAASGIAPGDLLSVFTSAHGDLGITDAMCSALAANPALVSPTKFLNSVHNAASGYWGIATACGAASTAVSGAEASFAAGLLEALTQCAAESRPVLLAGYDVAARGALASTNTSRGLLGVALVLAPTPSPRTLAAMQWSLEHGPAARAALRSGAARALGANAMADALPLFEALARESAGPLALPLGARLALRVVLGGFVLPSAERLRPEARVASGLCGHRRILRE